MAVQYMCGCTDRHAHMHTYTGLHLGSGSRGGKIRFYESEGVMVHRFVCVSTWHGNLRGGQQYVKGG